VANGATVGVLLLRFTLTCEVSSSLGENGILGFTLRGCLSFDLGTPLFLGSSRSYKLWGYIISFRATNSICCVTNACISYSLEDEPVLMGSVFFYSAAVQKACQGLLGC
jgi:hypothetical protein